MRTDEDLVRRNFPSLPSVRCPSSTDLPSSFNFFPPQWQSSKISIAYAFNLTVRGLLAALPSPVERFVLRYLSFPSFPSSLVGLLILDSLLLCDFRKGQKMYKPDWFDMAKKQRANEINVDDISTWCAKLGLGMGGGGRSFFPSPLPYLFFFISIHSVSFYVGHISRQTLTTQLIPELRHLEIPPSYPGSFSSLSLFPQSIRSLS